MAKKIYKAICETVNQGQGRGTAMFSIGGETIPAKEPGKPATRTAKTIISVNETDNKKVSDFEVGKQYTITIE